MPYRGKKIAAPIHANVIRRLLKIPKTRVGTCKKAIFLLLYYTRLKTKDIFRVTVDQFRIEDKILELNDGTIIELPEPVCHALNNYLSMRSESEHHELFLTPRGKPYSLNRPLLSTRLTMQRTGKSAGLNGPIAPDLLRLLDPDTTIDRWMLELAAEYDNPREALGAIKQRKVLEKYHPRS